MGWGWPSARTRSVNALINCCRKPAACITIAAAESVLPPRRTIGHQSHASSVVHACEQLCTAASRRPACVERERFCLHVLCCKPRVAIGACHPCLQRGVQSCDHHTILHAVMHRSKQLPGLSMPAAVKNGATVMSSIKGAECNTQSTGYRRRGPTVHTPIICLLGMLHGACDHACCAVPGGHKNCRKVTLCSVSVSLRYDSWSTCCSWMLCNQQALLVKPAVFIKQPRQPA